MGSVCETDDGGADGTYDGNANGNADGTAKCSTTHI